MPFIAIDTGTGERVDITDYEVPKIQLRNRDFVCPVCKEPMHVRHTLIVTAHFAHNPNPDRDCPFAGGESLLHLSAKKALVNRLGGNGSRYKEFYNEAKFEKEVWFPEIQRKADILITFPDGEREAHEIQLSPITAREFEDRTLDYLRVDINVYWWLGPKLVDTPGLRDWFLQEYGYFATVRPEETQVI